MMTVVVLITDLRADDVQVVGVARGTREFAVEQAERLIATSMLARNLKPMSDVDLLRALLNDLSLGKLINVRQNGYDVDGNHVFTYGVAFL